MKRPFFPPIAILGLGLSAALLHAKPPKDWKQATWKVPKEQFNVIQSINPSARTVSISHEGGKIKQEHNLTVNAFTEIIVNGTRTNLASLQVGMRVDYAIGGDGTTAARIETREEKAPPPTPVPTATPSFPNFDKRK